MTDVGKPQAKGDMKCPLAQADEAVCPPASGGHLRGKHPQGEEIIDHWGCAIAWMPVLTVENSQMQRQTGARRELPQRDGAASRIRQSWLLLVRFPM
jgi:hypothetical protein